MYSVPDDLRYSTDHEWARLEDGGLVRIGVTDFAQQNLGDIVFVDLPAPDTDLTAGTAMGEIESPKAASEILSPVSGRCVETNPEIADTPELVNQDPYGRGWLILVQPADSGEYEGLMDSSEYQALTQA